MVRQVWETSPKPSEPHFPPLQNIRDAAYHGRLVAEQGASDSEAESRLLPLRLDRLCCTLTHLLSGWALPDLEAGDARRTLLWTGWGQAAASSRSPARRNASAQPGSGASAALPLARSSCFCGLSFLPDRPET